MDSSSENAPNFPPPNFPPPNYTASFQDEGIYWKMMFLTENSAHLNTHAILAYSRHLCQDQKSLLEKMEKTSATQQKVIEALRAEVWEAELRNSMSRRVLHANMRKQIREIQGDYINKIRQVQRSYTELSDWINRYNETNSASQIEGIHMPKFEPLTLKMTSMIYDVVSQSPSTPQAMDPQRPHSA